MVINKNRVSVDYAKGLTVVADKNLIAYGESDITDDVIKRLRVNRTTQIAGLVNWLGYLYWFRCC